jgi:hypothetical protein
VQRVCTAALKRMVVIRPLRYQEEGAHVDIVAGYDPICVKLRRAGYGSL